MLYLNNTISIELEDKSIVNVTYSMKEEIVNNSHIFNLKVEILNSNSKDDTIFIEGVTDNKDIAKDIFNILLKFKVTPSTVINVLDDYFYKIYNK